MGRRMNSRRIAVPVLIVVVALSCKVLAPRRLRKLPDIRERYSAMRRSRRRYCASRRWRTCVVRDPKADVSPLRILANVFRGNNAALPFLCRNSGAIHTGPESGGTDRVHPGVDVGFLL